MFLVCTQYRAYYWTALWFVILFSRSVSNQKLSEGVALWAAIDSGTVLSTPAPAALKQGFHWFKGTPPPDWAEGLGDGPASSGAALSRFQDPPTASMSCEGARETRPGARKFGFPQLNSAIQQPCN